MDDRNEATTSAVARARVLGGRLRTQAGGVGERLRRSTEPLTSAPPAADLLPRSGADDKAAAAILHRDDPLGSATPLLPGVAIDPDTVVLASLLMAASIATQALNDDAAERMTAAVRAAHNSMTATLDLADVSPEGTLRLMIAGWDDSQRTTLLIELALTNPFAPYEHDWPELHRHQALAHVAEAIDLSAAAATRVITTFQDATRAHRNISIWRASAYGVAGAAIVGGAGFLAAPVAGAALGSAAGLSGAAAASHGLALLGGLGAAPTMAAGTWLVAQAGAVTGALGAVSGSALFQLGAAQTQSELIKLQVAAKLVLVDLQHNSAAAQLVAERLDERVQALEARLEIELALNSPTSDRIQTLRRNVQALSDAHDYVEDHIGDDDGRVRVDLASLDRHIASMISTLAKGDAWQLLDGDDRAAIEATLQARFRIKANLDRYDSITAVMIGVAAGIVDSLLVATPATSTLTAALRDMAASPNNWLSNHAPVPFDQSIGDGFTPNNHRALTPGHDPLVGLIWGTLDILGATMTRSSIDGGFQIAEVEGGAAASSLLDALGIEIAHLLSDICTPAGLPLPGWAAVVGSETAATAATTMYTRGYDTWHALPMSVPVASVELLTAVWASKRSYATDDPRLDAIRLIAHGVAASADLVQLVMTGGNPLVINYVQWLTLARRIASVAATQASANVTANLIDDLDANRAILNRGWTALLG